MATILVADDDQNIRDLLVDTLTDAGYAVIGVRNGGAALEIAFQHPPDLIVLDVMMPVMDGMEVLRRLRGNPYTKCLPVILLTVLPAARGERIGMSLGVSHYITKPWEPGMVEAAVKVALREAGVVSGEFTGGNGTNEPGERPIPRTSKKLFPLQQRLGGGIPARSLTLIEGASSSGKTVLCQHLMHGALLNGDGVALFTSAYTTDIFTAQMGSVGMDVSGYPKAGKLGIYPIGEPAPERGPEGLLASLHAQIEAMPRLFRFVVADDITDLASQSNDKTIVRFFTACKRMCSEGRAIVLVASSYAFDERLLTRLHALCNAHLSLRAEKMGAKLVKVMEIRKLHNADLPPGNVVGFEVQPGVGLRILPAGRTRV